MARGHKQIARKRVSGKNMDARDLLRDADEYAMGQRAQVLANAATCSSYDKKVPPDVNKALAKG